jgi:hypothetical protein
VFYAATMRFAAVFVASLHVIASMAREFQDKGLDVALAVDLPRSHYILGKLAGFLVIVVVLAVAAGLPMLPLTGLDAVAQWSASLAVELAVVAALALFCVITFTNLMPAMSFVMAFYVFARTLTAIRLISDNPIADADAWSHRVMRWLVEGLAFVVPPLDRWTQTAWLVNEPSQATALLSIVAQGAILIALLAAAAVFDMHRRNL